MALFLVFVWVVPALAAPLVHGEKFEWTNEGTVWCTDYGFDFDLHVRSDITSRTTFIYDQNGNLAETRSHYRGVDTVTNLASGLVASGHFSTTVANNWNTFIETVNGVEWMLRAPRRGVVFHSAGRLILDYSQNFPPDVVFEGGRHDYLGGDLALCYAMD